MEHQKMVDRKDGVIEHNGDVLKQDDNTEYMVRQTEGWTDRHTD